MLNFAGISAGAIILRVPVTVAVICYISTEAQRHQALGSHLHIMLLLHTCNVSVIKSLKSLKFIKNFVCWITLDFCDRMAVIMFMNSLKLVIPLHFIS